MPLTRDGFLEWWQQSLRHDLFIATVVNDVERKDKVSLLQIEQQLQYAVEQARDVFDNAGSIEHRHDAFISLQQGMQLAADCNNDWMLRRVGLQGSLQLIDQWMHEIPAKTAFRTDQQIDRRRTDRGWQRLGIEFEKITSSLLDTRDDCLLCIEEARQLAGFHVGQGFHGVHDFPDLRETVTMRLDIAPPRHVPSSR